MKVEVLMPKMGESITEGRILKWLKKPGDPIDRDETLVEISTDKVDTEVPSPEAGIVVQLLVNENDSMEVNKPIAIIETNASEAKVIEASPAMKTPPIATPTTSVVDTPVIRSASENVSTQSPAPDSGQRFYSPVVMRMAAESGISVTELASITGSGINQRVTKQDLLAYIEKRKQPSQVVTEKKTEAMEKVEYVSTETVSMERSIHSPVSSSFATAGTEIIPMDNMHRVMAEHMVRSKATSPHVTIMSEVDVTPIANFRNAHAESFRAREGFSLTFMPFIADAAIRALKDFPYVNASVEGANIVVKKFINLGIAVALESGGLIVPVVKNADALNLVGLGRSIYDVASRARKKRLQPDEIQGGTFSITNFGVFGNVFGTPIINQPQVAILGVGAVQKRPVVIEKDGMDLIAVRSMMFLSLSFDHRLVDGALGGMYLERVVKYLEEFSLGSI